MAQTKQIVWGIRKAKEEAEIYTQAWREEEGRGLMCDLRTAPYLTLQGVSLLGPGHLQVLGQCRELVAPCPVVAVAGQGLGLPGVDQGHHVHGQVALGSVARRLPPVLKLTLQPAHPLAVLEPGVVSHTLGPDQPPSLLHKVVPVEKLEGGGGGPGGQGLAFGTLTFHLCVFLADSKKITCSYTRRR